MALGYMPLQAPMTIAQGIGQGTNMMQQYTANNLANQAQQIQNQYQPNLLQNQVLNGQITNQYLPQMDQAQINYQNAMTQWMPMGTIAKMMSGLGSVGRAQAYAMMAQKNASPLVGTNGVAPGMVQGAINNANFLSMNPMSMMQMLQKGQNPMGSSVSPAQQVTNQGPVTLSQQQPQAQQAMAPITQDPSNGVPQGYMLKNSITGAYTDSNNNVIQPESIANQTYDQRSMAAISRINDQMPDLLQLAQFQNMPTDTKAELQGFANRFGGNYQLPEAKAAGEAALQTIPESMLKAYGLNGTNELYTAMKEAIEPKDNESPIEYQNRVYAQQYMLKNFAQQGGDRLNRGITLNDYNPLTASQASVKINGLPLSQYTQYANKNKIALPDLIQANFPPSEIDAYATKYKMTPQQVITMIKQKQGAANAGG